MAAAAACPSLGVGAASWVHEVHPSPAALPNPEEGGLCVGVRVACLAPSSEVAGARGVRSVVGVDHAARVAAAEARAVAVCRVLAACGWLWVSTGGRCCGPL